MCATRARPPDFTFSSCEPEPSDLPVHEKGSPETAASKSGDGADASGFGSAVGYASARSTLLRSKLASLGVPSQPASTAFAVPQPARNTRQGSAAPRYIALP